MALSSLNIPSSFGHDTGDSLAFFVDEDTSTHLVNGTSGTREGTWCNHMILLVEDVGVVVGMAVKPFTGCAIQS